MSVPAGEGGCLCGALRYALSGPSIDAGYCHCRFCQRASGAPVVFRRGSDAETVEVTLASLDRPADITPQYHILCMICLPWFDIRDTLARHLGAGPDTHDPS